jgi:hypothetical protein
MKEFWNERYKELGYAYGEAPNVYFESCLKKLKPGKLLLPAEGEGRNGVFAASHHWIVDAFDISEEGKRKALLLAEKNKVAINYTISDFDSIDLPQQYYDAIALIYAHQHEAIRKEVHQKSNGYLIIEAFSKANIEYVIKNPKIGGPKDIAMLYTVEEVQSDFPDFTWEEAYETTTSLNEGEYHVGEGAVVRLFGKKK